MKKYLNSDISCLVNAILVVLILLASSCSSNWKMAYIQRAEHRNLDASAGGLASGNDEIISGDNQEVDEMEGFDEDTTYKADNPDDKWVVDIHGNLIGVDTNGIKLDAVIVRETKRKITPPDSNGRLNMSLIVAVPKDIMSSKWQMRLHPRIYIRQNKVETVNFPVEDLYVTGSGYRDMQIMGYERYANYLSKIAAANQGYNNSINLGNVLDTTLSNFVNKYQLEYFIMRNFPEIYSLKNDSTCIGDNEFAQIIGHGKDEVISHYYNSTLEKKNSKLVQDKRKRFMDWVYNPIQQENIQKDNVVISDTLERFDKIYSEVLEKIKKDPLLSKEFYSYLDSVKKDGKFKFPELKSNYFRNLDSLNDVKESNMRENPKVREKTKGKLFNFDFNLLGGGGDKFKLDAVNVISGSDTSNIYMEYEYSTMLEAFQYPNIDRVSIGITGELFEDTTHLFNFRMSERLDYPVISTANLADTTEIVYDSIPQLRKANHGANYSIEFEKNSAVLREGFGNNASVISDIKRNIETLLENAEFDLDSIIVSATASPEGAINVNERFSGQRSQAVSSYFKAYANSQRWKYKSREDSLRREHESSLASIKEAYERGDLLKEEYEEFIKKGEAEIAAAKMPDIDFKDYPIAENWDDLNTLVSNDEHMSNSEKNLFFDTWDKYNNLDSRENAMKNHSYYNYMSKELYPKIRVVKFEFHMHRKGQEHDTIWIKVPSERYLEGVKALRSFDYIKAENILRDYPSYNAAICFIVRNKPIQAINLLEDKSLKIDFEYFKAKRDSLTMLYVSEDSSLLHLKDTIALQMQEAKVKMDRAAKIEFLKAKAYVMRRQGEDDWNKALESYLFLLKMDALNGLYNVALTGEADIRGAVFGSSQYFFYTAQTDEYLQYLPRMSVGSKNFNDIIGKYKEDITFQMKKEEVKYYNKQKMQDYLEEREAWTSMGYSDDIVDKIIFLGIDPPEIEY